MWQELGGGEAAAVGAGVQARRSRRTLQGCMMWWNMVGGGNSSDRCEFRNTTKREEGREGWRVTAPGLENGKSECQFNHIFLDDVRRFRIDPLHV